MHFFGQIQGSGEKRAVPAGPAEHAGDAHASVFAPPLLSVPVFPSCTRPPPLNPLGSQSTWQNLYLNSYWGCFSTFPFSLYFSLSIPNTWHLVGAQLMLGQQLKPPKHNEAMALPVKGKGEIQRAMEQSGWHRLPNHGSRGWAAGHLMGRGLAEGPREGCY